MNYSEVLNPYQPLETGDFMYRYYINDREYIIYSPERNKISCLELFDFKDLSAYQLSISIQAKVQVQSESEELKEFRNGEHERVDIHRRADGKASTPKIKPCKDHQNK